MQEAYCLAGCSGGVLSLCCVPAVEKRPNTYGPVAEWSVAAHSQLERLGAHAPRGASFGELLRALWAVTARARTPRSRRPA